MRDIAKAYELLGDYSNAWTYDERALKAMPDDPFARIGIARLTFNGDGCESDPEKVFRIIHEIRDCEGHEVHMMLARMYKNGHGTDRDLDEAETYFLRAHSRGNLMALRFIALILWEKKQYFKAIWFQLKAIWFVCNAYRKDKYDRRLRIG